MAFFDFGYTKISKSYENLNTNYTEKVVLYTYSFHSPLSKKEREAIRPPFTFLVKIKDLVNRNITR